MPGVILTAKVDGVLVSLTARDLVRLAVAFLKCSGVDGVVAAGPEQLILAGTAYQKVVSGVPEERVTTVLAVELVCAAPAEAFVPPGPAERRVVARVQFDPVRPEVPK